MRQRCRYGKCPRPRRLLTFGDRGIRSPYCTYHESVMKGATKVSTEAIERMQRP